MDGTSSCLVKVSEPMAVICVPGFTRLNKGVSLDVHVTINWQLSITSFNQKTGEPMAILKDEAHLTDVRTAVAGFMKQKDKLNGQTVVIVMCGGNISSEVLKSIL